jgi:hypothetical protein
LVSFLKAVTDGFPRARQRVANFMRLYAKRPTLQTLARGGPADQRVAVVAAVGVFDALAGARRQVRVDRDHRDAEIGRAEGRARVEAHPAEQQDEGARDDEDDVVRREGARLPVRAILPDARSEDGSVGSWT